MYIFNATSKPVSVLEPYEVAELFKAAAGAAGITAWRTLLCCIFNQQQLHPSKPDLSLLLQPVSAGVLPVWQHKTPVHELSKYDNWHTC